MPYCLACGTKTDFERADCPTCGEAILRRVEPPGDVVPEPAPAEGGSADADAAGERTGSDAGETAPRALPETDPDGPSPFADRWSLSFAARSPLGDGYGSLVVGGVIEFFAVVLPFLSIVTAGYGFRLLRATARGQRTPPAFEDFGQLLTDGMKLVVVLALYTVVALFGTVAGVAVLAVDEPLGVATLFAVAAVTLYPLPGSLTVYAATDDLRAAFALGTAGQFVTSGTYLRAWLAWLVGLVVVALVAVVSLVTLVGPFVVRAWATYSLAALWGYYYRRAAARDAVPPAPAAPVP